MAEDGWTTHGQDVVLMESSGGRRRWTRQEDERLRFLGELGWSPARIAGDLRRSLGSIYWRAAVIYGGLEKLRSGTFAVRSARQVAQLLGVSEMRVLRWITSKRLHARRNHGRAGQGRRRRWLISDDALLTFLARRETWMLWTPDTITDADWRREAQALRDEAGGHWLRLVTWADEIGYAPETVVGWIRSGSLTGSIKVDGVWYLWSTYAEAWIQRRSGWTPRQLSIQLGISEDTLRDWIANRMLDAVSIGSRTDGSPVQYLVPYESVERFIRNRRYWMRWSPEHLRDPRLRAYAELARARAAGSWMDLHTWAGVVQISPKRAWTWARRGKIPAHKHAGSWWVWVPETCQKHWPIQAPLERRVAGRSRVQGCYRSVSLASTPHGAAQRVWRRVSRLPEPALHVTLASPKLQTTPQRAWVWLRTPATG